MQMHSSYVVTDPKGQLLSEVGTMLRRCAPKLDENGKPMRDARGKVIYEPVSYTHLDVYKRQFPFPLSPAVLFLFPRVIVVFLWGYCTIQERFGSITAPSYS